MSASSAAGAAGGTPLAIRIAVLLAAVCLAVAARMDTLVVVATSTDWIDPNEFAFRLENQIIENSRVVDYCDVNPCVDLRLAPPVLATYVIASIVFFTATLIALWYFAGKLLPTKKGEKAKPPATAVTVSLFLVLLAGSVSTAARWTGARGQIFEFWFVGYVEAASLISIGFWLTLGLSALVALMLLRAWLQADDRQAVSWDATWAVIKRQRASLIVVAVFAAALLAIPFTVDQIGDALRSLSFDGFLGVSQSLFLIGAAALLSLTVLSAWWSATVRSTRS